MNKEEIRKMFDDAMEYWLRLVDKDANEPNALGAYLSGVIDGLFIYISALNPEDCKLINKVRVEVQREYENLHGITVIFKDKGKKSLHEKRK